MFKSAMLAVRTAATNAWDAVTTLRTASNEGNSNDAEWRKSTNSFDPP